eukprot:3882494-Pleurochrysis_carterae.AAC.1
MREQSTNENSKGGARQLASVPRKSERPALSLAEPLLAQQRPSLFVRMGSYACCRKALRTRCAAVPSLTCVASLHSAMIAERRSAVCR